MKIIGIVASPRLDGNTAWTVGKILEGAKEQGAETELWSWAELDIKPCQSCYGCKKLDRCVINDDMQKIYESIKSADAIVFGSPIYMGQMSAQAKTIIDRLFAEFHPRFAPGFKEELAGKKMALVFTQGNPDATLFQEYFDYTKKMFQMLEFDVKSVQVVPGTRSESVKDRADFDISMKTVGASLVS